MTAMDPGERQPRHEPPAPTKAAEPAITAVDDETEAETPKMTHDSMVTVRLSEPPALTLDATAASDVAPTEPAASTVGDDAAQSFSDRHDIRRDSSATASPTEANRSLQDELGDFAADGHESDFSDDPDEVNWEQLEKTEDEQVKDDETDNVRPSPAPSRVSKRRQS